MTLVMHFILYFYHISILLFKNRYLNYCSRYKYIIAIKKNKQEDIEERWPV